VLKYAKKHEKHPQHNLKHDYQISVIFGIHISDTTGY